MLLGIKVVEWVQLATLAVVVWYTVETYKLRRLGDEQLSELRRSRIREADPEFAIKHSGHIISQADRIGGVVTLEVVRGSMRDASLSAHGDYPQFNPEVHSSRRKFVAGDELMLMFWSEREQNFADLQGVLTYRNAGGFHRRFVITIRNQRLTLAEMDAD